MWLSSVIDQAYRESNPSSLISSRNDGNKVIIIKGRINDHDKCLKIFEILRNGKEFHAFTPCDHESSRWANVVYVLRLSFGDEVTPTPLDPKMTVDSFPGLSDAYGGQPDLGRLEVSHREKDQAIKVSKSPTEDGEEVWARSVICYKLCVETTWEEIMILLCEELNMIEEVVWIVIGPFKAILVCSSKAEASHLIGKKFQMPLHDWIEFNRWSPDILSLNYKSLFK